MSAKTVKKVKVTNRLGLHARPAMLLAETAQQFSAEITLRRTDQSDPVDAKSIMQIMMLAATAGTELEITAKGEGAQDAVRQLTALVKAGFNEN
ncbi:MAG: HPr family phosphocarrier protein [Phycisphaerales bacterium]|nr:HPr family phosphocarrier protein [Phycisphaerales bacterium]